MIKYFKNYIWNLKRKIPPSICKGDTTKVSADSRNKESSKAGI